MFPFFLQMRKKPDLLRKLIAILGLYLAKIDANCKAASITKKNSLKSKLALQVYRTFKKIGYLTPSQIFVQLYLLRPQWLSMMIVSLILSDMSGLSLQNLASLDSIMDKFKDKQLIESEKSRIEIAGNSDLHEACR